MEAVPCFHCTAKFIPRNRKPYCCSRAGSQRSRKAAWKRIKMKTDPDFRAATKLSHTNGQPAIPATGKFCLFFYVIFYIITIE